MGYRLEVEVWNEDFDSMGRIVHEGLSRESLLKICMQQIEDGIHWYERNRKPIAKPKPVRFITLEVDLNV